MTVILRRRRLGRTSCREVAKFSQENIVVSRNDRAFPEGHDLVIRWGCTSNVPVRNVLNRAQAIHEVNDKLLFRLKMDEEELCPATWASKEEARLAVPEGTPLLFRPRKHSRGRHCYVGNSPDTDSIAVIRCAGEYYVQEIIEKTSEFRVFVVQGRAVAVARKTPGNPDDLAWNVAQGGRFDNVRWDDWPLKAVRVSIEAFDLSSLDFGGVDVMIDKDGECYVLEINSAPSLTSPYRQECFSKAFDYIIRNGKDRLPLVDERGGYLKFIHPAIHEGARMKEQGDVVCAA